MLNDHQQAVVDCRDTRIACLAAPGSGKTHTLTERVISLLQGGYHPSELLCLTFTRKAAAEMRERIHTKADEVGVRSFGLEVATFHAWGVRVLREYADVLGMSKRFTVRDPFDRSELVLFVGKELGYKFKTATRLWKEDAVRDRYWSLMRECEAIDFDGIEELLYRLLDNEGVAAHLRERFPHVLVDETQDTSASQQAILDRLNPTNLFVVGDHAQSLYGFRGAHVDGFIDLTRRDDWTVLTLPINYRSDQAIVDVATACGEAMRVQGLTQVAASNDEGSAELIEVRSYEDRAVCKAEALEHCLIELKGRIASGTAPKRCAILAPTWRHLDDIAPLLERDGIPHVVTRRAMEVFSRPAARWFFAALRWMANPADLPSGWLTISTGTNKASPIAWVKAKAEVAAGHGELQDHIDHPLLSFLVEWRDSDDLSATLALLARELVRSTDDESMREDLVALVDPLDQVVDALLTELPEDGNALDELLTWYATRQVGDIEDEERADAVQLMTVHASKGLEWDCVWVLGVQEGSLPRRGGDLEEQRRLFYVASTRAAHHLRWVAWSTPSRFLEEVSAVTLAPPRAHRSVRSSDDIPF